MLYYNLKLALRNLFRHRTFSFINILGLSIGLASCIIIGLYAFTELSFDKFNVHHSLIYRINKTTNEKGKKDIKMHSLRVFLLKTCQNKFLKWYLPRVSGPGSPKCW